MQNLHQNNSSLQKELTITEHLKDLRSTIIQIITFFFLSFGICCYFASDLLKFLLVPLQNIGQNKLIFTGLAEVFISYIKLSLFISIAFTIPFCFFKIYQFLKPGLYKKERKIAILLMIFSPILFYLGAFFVFFIVMPKAWQFFLSFEYQNQDMSIILEARISEYISLATSFLLAFGIAFQMPIFLIAISLFGIISSKLLKKYRRFAIVMMFIIAAIFTPPDVFSQIALGIPMILLYEITILIIRKIEKNHI